MRSNRKTAVAVALGLGVLTGCGGGDTESKKEPMPMEQTVYGDQVKALEQAREQRKEMEGRMDDLNQQLKNAGQ